MNQSYFESLVVAVSSHGHYLPGQDRDGVRHRNIVSASFCPIGSETGWLDSITVTIISSYLGLTSPSQTGHN